MNIKELCESLECNPVIAAFQENGWYEAIESPAKILFCLKAKIKTVAEMIAKAHEAGKIVFIHIDLAEGIGKDRDGIEFLASSCADGIISTRSQLIRVAKDCGLATVQRFFALDSKGLEGISEMAASCKPDMREIMPGVLGKVLKRFANKPYPVIAGGLVETKAEVTEALSQGASAVSTGKRELWYM